MGRQPGLVGDAGLLVTVLNVRVKGDPIPVACRIAVMLLAGHSTLVDCASSTARLSGQA